MARIRGMKENQDKQLKEIEWSKYSFSIGETVELCAGLMDKSGKDPLHTVKEEILEECGFNVSIEKIQFVKSYL